VAADESVGAAGWAGSGPGGPGALMRFAAPLRRQPSSAAADAAASQPIILAGIVDELAGAAAAPAMICLS
jgi:hypothetical protein